jgi:hypothetical protein
MDLIECSIVNGLGFGPLNFQTFNKIVGLLSER